MGRIAKSLLALSIAALGAPALAAQPDPPAADDMGALPPQTAPAELKIDENYGQAWLGAADGDVTLVDFADYACPACREAQTVIDQLIAGDPRLRIVYRILINEPEGREAALTSLAVAKSKGDWAKFHRALDAGGEPNAAAIAAALAAAGVDPQSLPKLDEEAMLDSPIMDELIHNTRLLIERKGKALPAWVLGDGAALNGFDAARLKLAIDKARRRPARAR
jgi:protein-disulfide isomerase